MAHAGSLVRRGDADEDLAVGLYNDWRNVELPPEDRVMLDYVERLNASPSGTTPQDLDKLRQAGFTDENITDIVMLTAYRAMLNRLHDALGVPLDQFYERNGARFVDRFSR